MPRTRKNVSAQVVTGVAESRAEDQGRRLQRYLVTMSVRTACFVLMVVVDGWMRWIFAAGAVFLPFFAVVAANAARPLTAGRVRPVVPVVDQTRQLTAGAVPTEPVSRRSR